MMQVQFPSPSSPYPASLSELIFNYKRSVTTLEKIWKIEKGNHPYLLYSFFFSLTVFLISSGSVFWYIFLILVPDAFFN